MAKGASSISPTFYVDVRDFARFAKALRKAEPAAARELRGNLRLASEIVAQDYGYLVQGASKSVPPSIKVRISGALNVAVEGGGESVPMAGLLELGNKGSTESATFRHPVFGNKAVWVEQPMHPALGPAVEANADRVEVLTLKALDAALEVVATDDAM